MIRFALFLLLSIPAVLRAQQQYDTIYHPFYDHVQLIEIRPKYTPADKGFTETGPSVTLHTYILRTDRGETEWLNADNKPMNDESLKPVNARNETVFHFRKLKNTSSHVGYNDMGYNMLYPVRKKGKNGLMDTLGELRLPIEFDEIKWFDSVFIARKGSKYELYDHQFRKIVQGEYDTISYVNTLLNHLIIQQDGKYGMIRRNGDVLMPLIYQNIYDSEHLRGNYAFQAGGKWGFMEHSLQRYLQPFSPSPYLQRRGDYFVYPENGSWILIDEHGKVLLQTQHLVFDVLSPTRFITGKYENGYQKSICDEKGNVLTDKIYYDLCKFNAQTVMAGYDAKAGTMGYVSSTKWILLDINGQKKNEKVYNVLMPLDSSWMKAYRNGRLAVIDDAGQERLDFRIDDIYKYTDHNFRLSIDKKYMFIDLANPAVRSQLYEMHQMVRGNRIAVMNNQKWGFMDSSFRVVIPMIFDKVEDFREGVAAVQSSGQWSVIGETGKVLAETGSSHPLLLGDGYTQIRTGGKYGIIDRNGRFAVPPEYDEIRTVIKHEGTYFITAKKGSKYGIIDIYNRTAYPFIFEYYAEISVHSGIAQRRQDGFYAYLTIDKRKTIERYYLNFDPRKDQLVVSGNYSNGFTKVSKATGTPDGGAPYGVKNWDGQIVIPCIYLNIDDYRNYTFRIYTPEGCGLIDTAGKILIAPKYKYLYDLGSGTNYIQAGRHTGGWGLFTYQGKMLADTLYGGFERPVFGLIPFFANPNYRFSEKEGWIHDEQKVGFMDSTGRVLIEPVYERYTVPDQKKQEIALISPEEVVYIDPQGKILRKVIRAQAGIRIPVIPPPELTKKELKRQRKQERRQQRNKKRHHSSRMI